MFNSSYKVRALKRAFRKASDLRTYRANPSAGECFLFKGPCPCCAGTVFRQIDVLGDELAAAWRLAAYEIAYINRQQGFRCTSCGCNLRSMALGKYLLEYFNSAEPLSQLNLDNLPNVALLEINEAGGLHKFLKHLPGHVFAAYPAIDMQEMPYQAGSFDLVIHSDTLEHVPDPIRALSECRRVLRTDGICAFTVPVVVDRPNRSTRNASPSYHGSPESRSEDLRVHTEFGADTWKLVVNAGFREYRLISFEYPSALVHIAVK